MARGVKTVQAVPTPEPQASITPGMSAEDQTAKFRGSDEPANDAEADIPTSLIRLYQWAEAGGDISDLLPAGIADEVGNRAVREWEIDNGSRATWVENAHEFLSIAAQESNDEDEGGKNYPFENASDIHYPLLTTSSQQFAARAGPELIKGDKVVGVKVFSPPPKQPDPIEAAKAGPQPQNDQEAQQATQAIQAQEQQAAQQELVVKAKNARAERIKHYLNWLIFYKMDDWETETDLLLHQASIVGTGFKKVYMGTTSLCSDYVAATRLTVHNQTKSLSRCPRITQDFEEYPNEIEEKRRAGTYRDVDLPNVGEDPEAPRKFIEQHRLDDLDGDGLAEPYIVTVDVETRTTMSIVPAYTSDDIIINEASGKVIRIDRWRAFAPFFFLPDPKGGFYGIGFGKLLASIMDSVDTSINQLIDAGNAEIAGGGFIASGVRLQGSGQGGSVFFRPAEYQTVSTQGPDLRNAIWERTVPHPSAVTVTLLEMLLAAAKDIASVKDVVTGDSPATAPVGTTLALQNQALQVFSSIYKRMYRGFRDEFYLMYHCLKRWGSDREAKEYEELTGGDFHKDFTGDGTDIQPVADPSVVTKMQKISRLQTLLQLAESPVGRAAGMTQPGPAQAIVLEGLDVLDWDRPERFVAPVPPNPMEVAKAKDLESKAALNEAEAGTKGAQSTLDQAKALREVGLAAEDTHRAHQEADRIATTGSVALPPEAPEGGIDAGTTSPTPSAAPTA